MTMTRRGQPRAVQLITGSMCHSQYSIFTFSVEVFFHQLFSSYMHKYVPVWMFSLSCTVNVWRTCMHVEMWEMNRSDPSQPVGVAHRHTFLSWLTALSHPVDAWSQDQLQIGRSLLRMLMIRAAPFGDRIHIHIRYNYIDRWVTVCETAQVGVFYNKAPF